MFDDLDNPWGDAGNTATSAAVAPAPLPPRTLPVPPSYHHDNDDADAEDARASRRASHSTNPAPLAFDLSSDSAAPWGSDAHTVTARKPDPVDAYRYESPVAARREDAPRWSEWDDAPAPAPAPAATPRAASHGDASPPRPFSERRDADVDPAFVRPPEADDVPWLSEAPLPYDTLTTMQPAIMERDAASDASPVDPYASDDASPRWGGASASASASAGAAAAGLAAPPAQAVRPMLPPPNAAPPPLPARSRAGSSASTEPAPATAYPSAAAAAYQPATYQPAAAAPRYQPPAAAVAAPPAATPVAPPRTAHAAYMASRSVLLNPDRVSTTPVHQMHPTSARAALLSTGPRAKPSATATPLDLSRTLGEDRMRSALFAPPARSQAAAAAASGPRPSSGQTAGFSTRGMGEEQMRNALFAAPAGRSAAAALAPAPSTASPLARQPPAYTAPAPTTRAASKPSVSDAESNAYDEATDAQVASNLAALDDLFADMGIDDSASDAGSKGLGSQEAFL
ncbi:hypothetical protein CXG81DRAFT_24873 [Caulochytrium protostelioides]|uniref:Uncharacterized protein n=1 Tax=Caulochytrium protostelioides TaxID=1555241 RepID=A0A4P9XBI8_9FUNG|nr:hypothetical protein CXG81DRAFT_24873 [Caulochytrium protostelioides]|eukprot:RKP02500.1 hypothetical protein CXG81DRAFT_24873 [Caulochytrium protostelioides]